MSVVVAIKDKDRVWMGCDSQVTYGGWTKHSMGNGQHKIWKPNDDNDILMGVVGSLRDINILATAKEWLEELPKLKNEINYEYIVRYLTPKIFKELEAFNRVESNNGIKSICSIVTFAYKNDVYSIQEDGAVIAIDDFWATGSGFMHCFGAWSSVKDKKNTVKEKLIECVKAGCEDSLYVNYPIVIMNTKDNKVELIEKG